MHGSPSRLKARTFRATLRFPDDGKPQGSNACRVSRLYRNPVILAQEWQQAINNGEYRTYAEFAQRQGISRARVTQVLQILKLAPDVLISIVRLGNPLPSRIITERMLRSMVHRSADEQRQTIGRILANSAQMAKTSI
jgi:hypothetical protein